MKKRLKIAVYSGEIPSTTFIERLIEGLADSGHEILLFGPCKFKKKYPQPQVLNFGYPPTKFHKLKVLVSYSVLLYLFRRRQKKQLDHFIKNLGTSVWNSRIRYYPVLWKRPDIFHLQWAKSITDWIWVKEFGIQLVLSLRGSHINYSPLANPQLAADYRRYFPQVDGFHAVSKAIAREAQKYGADPSKIKVIYSGLKSEKTDTTPVQMTKHKLFHLVSVGRSHWVKGYEYALQAMYLLKQQEIPFRYTIIGAEPNEELFFLSKQLQLTEHVQWLNYLPFEEVQQHLKTADVLLLSSVEEGIANVVLEAMQVGTLVLSTDCGGMREVIQDGKNGFIVPVRDPESMAAALQKIYVLADSQKEEIRVAAQATIQQNHTLEKMVHDMCSLYEQVL